MKWEGKIGNINIIKRYKGSRFICKCDCGKELILGSRDFLLKSDMLQKTGFTGCGTCIKNKRNTKRTDTSIHKDLYKDCKRSAKLRNHSFNLDRETLTKLVTKKCHYCGEIAGNSRMDRRTKTIMYYNGIDRLDSNIGYEKGNCVPCCGICNRMKGVQSYQEFIKRVNAIFKRTVQRLERNLVDSSESKQ